MLAAMDIYCELLASPGVLKPDDRHLLDELRLLRDSSGKLLDRLLVEALKCLTSTDQATSPGRGRYQGNPAAVLHAAPSPTTASFFPPSVIYDPADPFDSAFPPVPDAPAAVSVVSGQERSPAMQKGGKRVKDVSAELRSNLPMLSALAGPRVHVSLEVGTCPGGELFMPPVDLTRVLINLVRNAAEAMSIGGRILISATGTTMPGSSAGRSELAAHSEPGHSELTEKYPAVMIAIEDNGPGIPLSLLDRIFDLQVSSATQEESMKPRMQFRPRGLGLRIVREFVEASGGSVRALRLPDRGSRFEIVLPMVTVKVTQVGSEL